MVLVTHDPSRQSCQGSDSASLIASVRCAIASEVPFAVTNLSYRVLGDSIVIEGNVIKRSNAELIHRIAEDIAGHGRVILGVGGINL
ncbi:hypothetical protein CDO30_20295 (plasmid) [Sinorhizobium meliloti]|uniref:BON domain-containing protein n=1 Tax=Sinorhizobium kummerowiae TaxID=158892 RepID=A0ABY8TEK1_9HYPH|nr:MULTISPECIES: hypothetical protein [Sinorhizobium]TWA88583.1 hypothetical protein FB000_14835 [Ensifer sp. SEMIA 134]TWB24082.1 hypothetical protein FB001_15135 [Ensifer sp. SEMIA 135]ASP61482.1 hypothetical protein CDO30_20295 [Sinorhizobium meliloti]MDW9615310.1 hypothetical protein [Sinorhizobium meliloti]MDW9838012.1 hypothetical protein [Sinorhizobium meliloti]